MAGANIVRFAWNNYTANTAVSPYWQERITSLGTGWFVTRIRYRIQVLWTTFAEQLPTSTNASLWPFDEQVSMIHGVQTTPLSTTPPLFHFAIVNDPSWWNLESVPMIADDSQVFVNPPYSGLTQRRIITSDRRYGAAPQAAAADFYVSVGFDSGQSVPLTLQFWTGGVAELTYG